ncbi:hypothetical protein P4V43_10530 [Brevibacillus fortis]|uniref:Uncharacterized protein n=1 Tax=Brevibacillus fortis TaxID=2126352 RepID=A0A2P7VK45_9BACL|nr:hypothetical protein [Brevibacillus fortis]MED1782250.1 hypothetical protein [Brevibacillus fortis]PSJ99588.1 hypothetical protein C7R93_02615 [Brevibacillus fortis]
MYKRFVQSWTKSISWALILSLLITTGAFAQPAQAAATSRQVDAALKNVVKYYYKADKDYRFSKDFDWELIGLEHAGEKLTSSKWVDDSEKTAIDFWSNEVKKVSEPGQLAKVSIGLMKNGYDPTNFNGRNLLKEIEKQQDSNGRLGDDQWTTFNHALSMIALEMYDYSYDREEAVDFLIDRLEDFTPSDTVYHDEWAFALHALSFVESEDGVNDMQKEIMAQLLSGRGSNGSLNDNPDTTLETLAAVASTGEDVMKGDWNKSVEYVLTQQLDDGSFPSAWSNGETSELTTQKGLYALAVLKKGNALFERLTKKEKTDLIVYRTNENQSENVKVYDGMTNFIKGEESTSTSAGYTISSKQLFVKADVSKLAEEKPVAILVKVMKGKSIVSQAIVESTPTTTQTLTAGLTLPRGTYSVEINFWYGLAENPEVAQDSVSFTVKVK